MVVRRTAKKIVRKAAKKKGSFVKSFERYFGETVGKSWVIIVLAFVLLAGSWMFLVNSPETATTGNFVLPPAIQTPVVISILVIIFVSLLLLKFKNKIFKK